MHRKRQLKLENLKKVMELKQYSEGEKLQKEKGRFTEAD